MFQVLWKLSDGVLMWGFTYIQGWDFGAGVEREVCGSHLAEGRFSGDAMVIRDAL